MSTSVRVTLLRDTKHGGQADQPTKVATELAGFIGAAHTTVDLAIYDFRLGDKLAAPVVAALTAAANRGVTVRIAYDASKPSTTMEFAALGADPAPPGTAAWLMQHFTGTKVVFKPITTPSGKLMHDKYIVVDGKSVWTGSTNFTDDAWTHQENNILQVDSTALATAYTQDFDELWQAGDIRGTGKGDTGTTTVGQSQVAWSFSPGEGQATDTDLVDLIGAARKRLLIASMVITSHTVLDALVKALDNGIKLVGIYDAGQMGPIAKEWAKSPQSATTLANWTKVSAHLASKHSTPYTPTGTHDFMHLKVLVSDDTVATGSYNFSTNAEGNAENQLRITAADVATQYATFVTTLVSAYS